YFHLFFWYFNNPIIAYKIVSFISIVFSSLLVFHLSARSKFLSILESWFVAAIYGCYSSYQVHSEIIMTPYIFCYMLFLAGICLSLIGFDFVGRRHFFIRIISLIIFSISFSINSLLVFFGPALLYLVVVDYVEKKELKLVD